MMVGAKSPQASLTRLGSSLPVCTCSQRRIHPSPVAAVMADTTEAFTTLPNERHSAKASDALPMLTPRLRPHRAPMNSEPARQRLHADALGAGCLHSVHFLVRQPCSRSFTWFRRPADQGVVGLAFGLGIPANALIPRGNQPFNPLSSVPAALHCFHQIGNVRTLPRVIAGQGFSVAATGV